VYNQPTQGPSTDSGAQVVPKTESMDVDVKPIGDAGNASGGDLLNDSSLVAMDTDARSDASFDPLFDDVPEEPAQKPDSKLAMPGISQTQIPERAPPTTIPPPKGAPPLFSPSEYANYSPELLMTAFIDGQVIIWDRRVQTSGKGVGRLWMSEKTPPWCLSVRSQLLHFSISSLIFECML